MQKKLERKEVFILVLGVFFGLLSSLLAKPHRAVLSIPDYGEENSENAVFYQRGEDAGEILFTMPARTYSDAQLKTMAEEAFVRLSDCILGENASMDEVCHRLILPDALPDFPFAITWEMQNTEVITREGEILNADLAESVLCTLTAELSYDDYAVRREYFIRVLPKEYSSQELFEQELAAYIRQYVKAEEAKEETEKANEFILPDTMLGADIYGSVPNVYASLLYPFFGAITVVFMRLRKKEAEKKRQKDRREALLYAYPVFANQLALYLSAGMTVYYSISEMAEHWRRQREPCMAVLLEETDNMLQMVKNGVSEREAYSTFGRACGLQEYQKLMTLLVRTIEIGGKGVLDSLEALEAEAFIMRREQARLKGETASAKLLFPMILLLAVVMALLIVPGFYGMGI